MAGAGHVVPAGRGTLPPGHRRLIQSSGITIVDDVMYMAVLRGQRLWQIPVEGDGVGEPVASLQGEHGRPRPPHTPGADRILRVTL